MDVAKDLADPDSLPEGWNVYLDNTSKRRFYNNRVQTSFQPTGPPFQLAFTFLGSIVIFSGYDYLG